MLNPRGQESAPFELLIAVIIMGFVIFSGMIAMGQLWEQRCYGITESKLEDFKTRLGIVVDQKSPQNISFRLSGCFNQDQEIVEIMDEDDPSICADYCGSPMRLCSLLSYSYEPASQRIVKCLSIPPETNFPSQKFSNVKCPNREDEGYELQDFDERIVQGEYLLINKTLATDGFPTICAYYKLD